MTEWIQANDSVLLLIFWIPFGMVMLMFAFIGFRMIRALLRGEKLERGSRMRRSSGSRRRPHPKGGM